MGEVELSAGAVAGGLVAAHRIVHGYWQISTSILFATAQDDIPALLEAVRIVGVPLQAAHGE